MQIISILSLLICFFPLFFYSKLSKILNSQETIKYLALVQITYFFSTRFVSDWSSNNNLLYADVCSFFNILLPVAMLVKNKNFQSSVATWAFVGGLTTFVYFIIIGNFYSYDGEPYYSIVEVMFIKFLDPPGTPGSWLMHWFLVFNSVMILIKNYKTITWKNIYYSSLLISFFLLYLEINRNIFQKEGNISALSEYEWSINGQYYIEKNLTPITDWVRELSYIWKIIISYILFFTISISFISIAIVLQKIDKNKENRLLRKLK